MFPQQELTITPCMNRFIYILLILIFAFSGCATTSSKDAKKPPPSKTISTRPDSAKSDSTGNDAKQKEVPLYLQYQRKGKNSARGKKYDEALEYFLKANKLKHDDENILLDTAIALRHLDRNEEALTYFGRVIELNPNSLESLRNIGKISRELKQDPEAIEAFSKLLEIEPGDEVSLINLADLYFKKKEYEICYKYISMFYENLGRYNFTNTDSDRFQKMSDIFNRFSNYMTVIDKERRRKINKVKPPLSQ